MTEMEPQEPPEHVLSPEEEEWLRHPHTRFLADHMGAQSAMVLAHLVDACQAPDASPRCASLAATYVWLVRTEQEFRGKKKP